MSEEKYADSILKDEFSGPSKPHEIVNGQYWLPPEWNFEYIDGRPLGELVRQSLANPFPDYNAAKGQLWNNPMFQAAVRLAYWVATHIPFIGWFSWAPLTGYCNYMSPMYYEGPAAPLLFPEEGWVCTDHAVLTVALYRAAGIPSYVAEGRIEIDGLKGDHAWTAVFVYDEKSGKWHEIFIDPTGPIMHELWIHIPNSDDEYDYASRSRPYDPLWGLPSDYCLILARRFYTNFCTPQGIKRLIDYTLRGGHLEFDTRNWTDRVRQFRDRWGDWTISGDEIERWWSALKSEWARWKVRESRSSTVLWVAVLIGLLCWGTARVTGNGGKRE